MTRTTSPVALTRIARALLASGRGVEAERIVSSLERGLESRFGNEPMADIGGGMADGPGDVPLGGGLMLRDFMREMKEVARSSDDPFRGVLGLLHSKLPDVPMQELSQVAGALTDKMMGGGRGESFASVRLESDSLIRLSESLDAAGRFEESDRIMRSVVAGMRREAQGGPVDYDAGASRAVNPGGDVGLSQQADGWYNMLRQQERLARSPQEKEAVQRKIQQLSQWMGNAQGSPHGFVTGNEWGTPDWGFKQMDRLTNMLPAGDANKMRNVRDTQMRGEWGMPPVPGRGADTSGLIMQAPGIGVIDPGIGRKVPEGMLERARNPRRASSLPGMRREAQTGTNYWPNPSSPVYNVPNIGGKAFTPSLPFNYETTMKPALQGIGKNLDLAKVTWGNPALRNKMLGYAVTEGANAVRSVPGLLKSAPSYSMSGALGELAGGATLAAPIVAGGAGAYWAGQELNKARDQQISKGEAASAMQGQYLQQLRQRMQQGDPRARQQYQQYLQGQQMEGQGVQQIGQGALRGAQQFGQGLNDRAYDYLNQKVPGYGQMAAGAQQFGQGMEASGVQQIGQGALRGAQQIGQGLNDRAYDYLNQKVPGYGQMAAGAQQFGQGMGEARGRMNQELGVPARAVGQWANDVADRGIDWDATGQALNPANAPIPRAIQRAYPQGVDWKRTMNPSQWGAQASSLPGMRR